MFAEIIGACHNQILFAFTSVERDYHIQTTNVLVQIPRARSQRKRTVRGYYKGRITPNWFNENTFFWYRNDLKDNTYYALIHFKQGEKSMSIDARPSDALALSLRMKDPIFLAEEVIMNSSQIDFKAEPEDKSPKGKKWQEILESLNPEDFGKYKM